MISISRIVPSGGVDNVLIETDVDFRGNTARVIRSKTLDGGVYINYSGVSDGDRTIRLSERLTEDQAGVLWAMFNEGVQVNVAIPDGFFSAAIQSCKIDNGAVTATIFLEERSE